MAPFLNCVSIILVCFPGETLQLTNDAGDRINLAKQSSGHSIQYEYDQHGNLAHIRDSQRGEEFFEYDRDHNLTAVRDAQHRPLLLNTYGDLDEVQSQTLADGEKFVYESQFDQSKRLISLKLTLPNGYTILWKRTGKALVCSLPQPPAVAGKRP